MLRRPLCSLLGSGTRRKTSESLEFPVRLRSRLGSYNDKISSGIKASWLLPVLSPTQRERLYPEMDYLNVLTGYVCEG